MSVEIGMVFVGTHTFFSVISESETMKQNFVRINTSNRPRFHPLCFIFSALSSWILRCCHRTLKEICIGMLRCEYASDLASAWLIHSGLSITRYNH